jgi:hypothetical protein
LADAPIHDSIVFRVRHFASLLALALATILAVAASPARAASARQHRGRVPRRAAAVVRGTAVAVQPIEGEGGPVLRSRIAQILRRRGFRVITELDAVTGTAQYPGIARDNDIAAFVVGGLEDHRHSQSVTFLIWNGRDGSVARRWSVAAAPHRLPSAVARGFWPRLGRTLAMARPPSADLTSPGIAPARPMRIDAADGRDDAIVSDGNFFRRRLPIRD